ncbi:unnamed protein product [Gongylonema pulchrum]|uniref:Uncharacterized protein n=1 Tax=Gongylonema pulchrum TaxID=637853 RepID=A0A183D188_9BILA|nr:unnamed protein product [Gongylonema pulchrum]
MEELHVGPAAAVEARQPFQAWQDWTNKNIFTSSIDETLISYQDDQGSATDGMQAQG